MGKSSYTPVFTTDLLHYHISSIIVMIENVHYIEHVENKKNNKNLSLLDVDSCMIEEEKKMNS